MSFMPGFLINLISAAAWKDEYAVKKLINLWKTNEPLFKSSKIRNDMTSDSYRRQIPIEFIQALNVKINSRTFERIMLR